MNFRSQTKISPRRTFVVVALLILLVVMYGFVGTGGLFASYARTVDASQQALMPFSLAFRDTAKLVEENKALTAKLDALTAAQTLSQSNAQAYLDLWRESHAVDSSRMTAQVLARPPYTVYDQYILKTANQLDEQSLVLVGDKYAIGYITATKGEYSQAQLFTAPGEEVVVSIDGVLYTAEGRGGGTLEVKLPRSYRDVTGSLATLPGGSVYVVGGLTDTEFDPQDSFVRGIISLPINIYTQELVTVTPEQYTAVEDIVNTFDADTQTD